MNGQPTAQNTRECGANGDLPGFRNWANDDHVAELAELWNVDPMHIPHHGPPTHAMEIFRLCRSRDRSVLVDLGTNPAVSLPELTRIRRILGDERLFVVVQDIFLTETAALADVVLPAATWGEKTGTFTNADRTVHLSRAGRRPAGRGPQRPGHLPGLRPTAWTSATGRRPARHVDDAGVGLRGLAALLAPAGRATTPASPTTTCAAAAASSGRARRAPDGTERLYTDGGSAPTPSAARPTAATC